MLQNVFSLAIRCQDIMVPRRYLQLMSKLHMRYWIYLHEQYSAYASISKHIGQHIRHTTCKGHLFLDIIRKISISKSIRKPYYTYENKRIAELFEDIKKTLQRCCKDLSMAASRIITMQDMVEVGYRR